MIEDPAFGQRTAAVRALIIDGKKRAFNIKDSQLVAVDLDQSTFSRRNFARIDRFNQLSHDVPISRSL